LKIAGKKGVARVFLFWKGGMWTYLGISLFVIIPTLPAFQQAAAADSLQRSLGIIFQSIGVDVGTAWLSAVEALMAVPAAAGVEYISLLVTLVISVMTVSWYFRTMYVLGRLIEGGDVSPVLILVFAVPLYLALVWGALGYVPVEESVASLEHLEDLAEWQRLLGGGNISSANMSVNVTG